MSGPRYGVDKGYSVYVAEHFWKERPEHVIAVYAKHMHPLLVS
jgi:hypothetical protein